MHGWTKRNFLNNSLFGKNKAIKIAKRLSAISFLTCCFHGNLIVTPTECNLGLIVLLSTNQNWVILWVFQKADIARAEAARAISLVQINSKLNEKNRMITYTYFVFLHSKNFNFLHCLGLIYMLSANQHGEIFSYILLITKHLKWWDVLTLPLFHSFPRNSLNVLLKWRA